MPRNVERKLNSKANNKIKVRLPLTINTRSKSLIETNTNNKTKTKANTKTLNKSETTTTTATTVTIAGSQKQQQKHKKQQQTEAASEIILKAKSVQTRTEEIEEKHQRQQQGQYVKPTTTATTITTRPILATTNTRITTGAETVAVTGKDFDSEATETGTATGKSPTNSVTTTTLYPIIIERFQQDDVSTLTTTTTSTTALNIDVDSKVLLVPTTPQTTTSTTTTPTKIQASKSTSITEIQTAVTKQFRIASDCLRKRKKRRRTRKSLNVQIATNENSRLSTLRARTSRTYALSSNTEGTACTKVEQINLKEEEEKEIEAEEEEEKHDFDKSKQQQQKEIEKSKIIKEVKVLVKDVTKARIENRGQQQQQQPRTQQAAAEELSTVSIETITTTTIKNETIIPQADYLNVEWLNKIEPLEYEVKKVAGGTKRKRDNSLSISTSIGCGLRRRCSKRKFFNNNSNNNNNNNYGSNKYIKDSKESAFGQFTDTTFINNNNNNNNSSNNNNNNNPTDICENNNNNNNSNRKRVRIMSLYERRYQTDDGGRGVVSNGYLTSTRTSSANSSNVVHADADAQDISSGQYYIATSSAAGNSVGGAVALSGSSNALNHAPSMATLCNIGNTCYLNSVVYTLRFAPQFLHNLHHLIVDLGAVQQQLMRHRAKSSSLGRGVSALHMESARSWSSKDLVALEHHNTSHSHGNAISGGGNNAGGNTACNLTQKSSHQLLTEKLHELYQSLHRNEVADSTEPFHADTLLHAIQDVSTIFEGNQQQDAHEFLMCLLNSIRETCQTLIKAIAEYPDVITNGYISNPDELDASYAYDRDANVTNNSAPVGSGNGLLSSASSLSTSNVTKSSFFSRKSKRKEEAKNSKNSRLQSPLKDNNSGSIPQQQATSNSLFYLNTVDLSSAPIKTTTNNTTALSTISTNAAAIKAGMETELHPLNALKDKEHLAEKIRELGLDFFSEDFEGVTVSTTKCLSCETITEQKESMIDIAVPVPISGYDSADYTEKPSAFIQNSCITREYFRGENKYRCEQCTGYTEAIRSISYEVLPRLLVIQLSRFSGGMEKINSYIPTSFTLQCFCAKCCELSDANKLHIYKLYSVITHVGATMSVGHYIAYTCALDWAATNEYVNCPKERRNAASQNTATAVSAQQQQQQSTVGSAANGLHNNVSSAERLQSQATSAASAAAYALASSGTSLMKKMKFGRSKASSSGDMSKHMKNLNGITSKTITNGIGKLSMNTTCHSLNCCATRICTVQQQQQQQQQQQLQSQSHMGAGDMISGGGGDETLPNGSYNQFPIGYGSTGRGGAKSNLYQSYGMTGGMGGAATSGSIGNISGAGSSSNSSSGGGGGGSGSNNAEPIWYMCDDDKIKAMTQREFEELLSPSRKITITPYLLFYARFNLQPTSASASASASTTTTTTGTGQPTPTKQTPSPQASWSSESIQSGSGSVGGASMKM